jgi:hypothetical protein
MREYVDVMCPDFDRFIPHTETSYAKMADDLKAASNSGIPKAIFHELEIEYGMNFNPYGVMQDKHARKHLGVPRTTYYDWMHCLLSSGGTMQYALNAFLKNYHRSDVDHTC